MSGQQLVVQSPAQEWARGTFSVRTANCPVQKAQHPSACGKPTSTSQDINLALKPHGQSAVSSTCSNVGRSVWPSKEAAVPLSSKEMETTIITGVIASKTQSWMGSRCTSVFKTRRVASIQLSPIHKCLIRCNGHVGPQPNKCP